MVLIDKRLGEGDIQTFINCNFSIARVCWEDRLCYSYITVRQVPQEGLEPSV